MTEQIFYTCPMHPEIREDNQGMCPECGMNLTRTKAESHADSRGQNYNKHEGHRTNIFKRKFWVSFVLSIPVVLYSDIVPALTGWQPPQFFGSGYIPLVLGTVIFFYGGWIFLTSAYRELRGRLPGMMTLISLAILTAYIYSIYVAVSGIGRDLFWELSTLITVMLLGHWMEMRAVKGAQSALQELSKLLPDKAERIIQKSKFSTSPPTPSFSSSPLEGEEGWGGGLERGEMVRVSELKVGDLILVRPGGRIPADGEVQEGESDVNEAMITGESRPMSKTAGDEVIAGTINGDGSLTVKVAKIGEQTFLAGVMRLVKEAQASKSRLQMLSDRAAFYLTLIAIVTGAATLVIWLNLRDAAFALERTVAVLVIACPHALGLAIPLVASISTTKAAQNGFLVRQRLALEQARNIDIVLFDKTGTLTKGEHIVVSVIPYLTPNPSPISERVPDRAGEVKSEEVLRIAAALESHSEHIIGKAIVKRAEEDGLEIPEVKDFRALPGKGVRGIVDGKEVRVGGPRLLVEYGISNIEYGNKDKTIVYVLAEGKLIGAIALADEIREESREALRALKAMGIKVGMITGDAEDVAKAVAEELGIDEYRAQVLPEDKVKIVKEFQAGDLSPSPSPGLGRVVRRLADRERSKVAFVGDGINDAPALAQADLGIAIGAGTNVAIESAGIILVKNDPRDIVKIIRLSKFTYSKMIQNLFWATGYNVIALPLAAGVLAVQGIVLQPALAALFMSVSTVIVAVNAMLLRGKQLS